MSDQKTTKGAVAEARAALATARISLDELEKLRAATRGPPPTLTALAGLLGRPYDGDDVVAVTGTLGLRKRKLPASASASMTMVSSPGSPSSVTATPASPRGRARSTAAST
jgi:hypothetical protein